jgi:hypothetical protein
VSVAEHTRYVSVAEHTRYVSVAEQNDFNDINNQGGPGDKWSGKGGTALDCNREPTGCALRLLERSNRLHELPERESFR